MFLELDASQLDSVRVDVDNSSVTRNRIDRSGRSSVGPSSFGCACRTLYSGPCDMTLSRYRWLPWCRLYHAPLRGVYSTWRRTRNAAV